MRKFYLLALTALFTLSLSAQYKIMVIADTSNPVGSYANSVIPIINAINAHDSLVVADTALSYTGLTDGSFDFSGFDGIVITEAGGSSTVAPIYAYVKNIPLVCMKSYAMHYGKSGWKWINNGSDPTDFVVLSPDPWDSALAAVETQVEVLADAEDFPIFDGLYAEGDVFNLFDGCWSAGAHLQGISFEHSDSLNIADNAYPVLKSLKMDTSAVLPTGATTNIMYVIDENASSPRNVIMAIHSQFADQTADFNTILNRSVLWIVGADDILTSNKTTLAEELSVYPNPAHNVLNVKGVDAGTYYAVYNITGQVVANGTLVGNSISVSSLPQGTYILKMGNLVNKFNVIK